MIFVSDLDKTLIFSKKHISENQKLLLAEIKRDEPQSFISEKTFNYIKSFINSGGIFIPATARTLEQYNRIFLLNFLKTKYVILCNGKSIMINGKIDDFWENKMNTKIKNLPFQVDEIFKQIKSITNEEINCDNKLYYVYDNYLAIISFPDKSFITKKYIKKLNQKMENTGWVAFACGRKLYISPTFIDKSLALKYIIEKYIKKDEKIIASGDSLYDLQMLKYADYAITPKHAEIANTVLTTENETFLGSIEIMEYVKNLVKS